MNDKPLAGLLESSITGMWTRLLPVCVGYLLCVGFSVFATFSGPGDGEIPAFQPFRSVGRGSLYGAAISPDAGQFLTQSGRGLQLWNLDGSLLCDLAMGGRVQAAYSNDGSRIAAALLNGTCLILDRHGRVLTRFGYNKPFTTVALLAWSGDDAKVAVSWLSYPPADQKVGIWSSRDGSLLEEFPLPGIAFPISWSHNATLLAVSLPNQRELAIYRTADWSVARTLSLFQVAALAWRNDDSRLAILVFTGSSARIHLWDPGTGSMTAQKDIGLPHLSLTWSNDGSMLAMPVEGGVRVFGAGLEDLLLLAQNGSVTSTSWFPDDSAIMTSCSDGSVEIMDVEPGEASILIQESTELVCLAQSMSGCLAYGMANGKVACVEQGKTTIYMDLAGAGTPQAMDWSPDGASLVVGYQSGQVAIWSLGGHLERWWPAHAGKVLDLRCSPVGGLTATVGQDGYLVVWDKLGSETCRKMVNDPATLDWSMNGSFIATGHKDGKVCIWRYPDLIGVSQLRRAPPVNKLRWSPSMPSPDRDLMAYGGAEDGSLVVWDAWGRGYYARLEGDGQAVNDLAWSGDGRMIATCSREGSVKIWDASFNQAYPSLRMSGLFESFNLDGVPTGLAWSPDSRHVLACCMGGELMDLGLKDRVILSMSQHPSLDRGGFDWSPQGEQIAYMPRTSLLEMYHVTSDVADLVALEGMLTGAGIGSVSWSPDGAMIAVAGGDSLCRVYSRRGALLFSMPHSGTVMAAAWSPDSQFLATATFDGLVNVWDGHTGSGMVVLEPHQERVPYLEWSEDGRFLISVSMDGDLKIHDLRTGEVAKRLQLGGTISCFAWNQVQGTIVYATFEASILTMIDMEANQLWVKPFYLWAVDARWSPNYRHLLVATVYSPILVLSPDGSPVCELEVSEPMGAEEVHWSPELGYVAARDTNGIFYFYDAGPIGQIADSGTSAVLMILSVLFACRSHGMGTPRGGRGPAAFHPCRSQDQKPYLKGGEDHCLLILCFFSSSSLLAMG